MKSKKSKILFTALIVTAIFISLNLSLAHTSISNEIINNNYTSNKIHTFNKNKSNNINTSDTIDSSAISPVKASYGYYVDSYHKNTTSNTTPITNPSIGVLSGFLDLWTPGTAWNNGFRINSDLLDENIAKVISITKTRSTTDEVQAYLDARSDRYYSVITGLGAYTDNFIKGANAGTTISDFIPADAATVNYEDGGNSNGVWADESSSLGSIVKLVNKVNKSIASTSAAKTYYKYKRPFYWSKDVNVISALIPSIKSNPAKDGGFPSGHTNAGYLSAFILAYAVPERFQELLTRASELGNNRIVAGVHSCLDVMGGRVMATAIVASVLNDPKNSTLKQKAYSQAQHVLLTQTGISTDQYSDYNTNKQKYTYRLTYGFKQTGDTTKPMIVPKGAEVLLETRLPYLDATQRRWVLYSTGLPSGYPLLDDAEGWGRLNLFSAANGYGAFNNDVTVKMKASKGGYNALDNWKNNISGVGSLTKQGTGSLILSGNNTYAGRTVLEQGCLIAASRTAFGKGDVINNGGTIIKKVNHNLVINGKFTQTSNGILELNIDSNEDFLTIKGQASLGGTLRLNFLNGYIPSNDIKVISFSSHITNTEFASIEINGLSDSYGAMVYDGGVVVKAISSIYNSTNTSAITSVNSSEIASEINSKNGILSSNILVNNNDSNQKNSDISVDLIYPVLIALCFICAIVIYRKKKKSS